MDPSVHKYYVEMKKDDIGGSESRFCMASPCKTNLFVYKEKTTCTIIKDKKDVKDPEKSNKSIITKKPIDQRK